MCLSINLKTFERKYVIAEFSSNKLVETCGLCLPLRETGVILSMYVFRSIGRGISSVTYIHTIRYGAIEPQISIKHSHKLLHLY